MECCIRKCVCVGILYVQVNERNTKGRRNFKQKYLKEKVQMKKGIYSELINIPTYISNFRKKYFVLMKSPKFIKSTLRLSKIHLMLVKH